MQDFPEEFMESANNELYCNLCRQTASCSKRCLVESHRNTSKHQTAFDSRSELLIPHILQTFLKSSNTGFEEKVTKAFLSIDILLYKLNNKHIQNLFSNVVTVCHMKLLAEKQYSN